MLHLLKKSLVLVATLTAALAAGAGLAAADTSYETSGSFATTWGSGDGELAGPRHVAVRAATNEVFVVDQGNNRVQVFAPDGAGSASYLSQFGAGVLNSPVGVAIDQANGDVYVSDASGVLKFVSDGAPVPTFTQDLTFTSPSATGPLAFDQVADQLLVADTATNTVRRFGAGGASGTTFDGAVSGRAFNALEDIAVQDDGDVIVLDGKRVVRFEDDNSFAATLPDLHGDPNVVTAVPGTDNLLVGQSGGYSPDYSAFLDSAHLYRYVGGAHSGTTVLPATIQGLAGLVVSGDASHNLYAVTGPGSSGGDTTVQVLTPFTVQPPVISGLNAVPSERNARVIAKINANNDVTSWTFEYGPTAAYGSRFPASPATINGGTDLVSVARKIGGLAPGTIYHYRIVATNGGGTTNSADKTFKTKVFTLPSSGDGIGPQRAYEQVSPVDKNAIPVNADYPAYASPSGDAIAYPADGAFPGADTAMSYATYQSRRSLTAWMTSPLTLPQLHEAYTLAGATLWVSEDFTKSVQFSRRALTTGAVEGGANLYLRDDKQGSLALIAGVSGMDAVKLASDLASYSLRVAYQATANLSHFVFQTSAHLLPDAAPGASNVYDYTDGTLKLVNRYNDGTVDPAGAVLQADGFIAAQISDDGNVIAYKLDGNSSAPLYVRVNDETTHLVSGSKRPGDDPQTPRVGRLVGGVSSDGSLVTFVSDADLTPDAQNDPGSLGSLYQYEVATGQLKLVIPPSQNGASGVTSVYGVSRDGSTVYFGTSLIWDGSPSDVNSLFAAQHGQVKYIASFYGGALSAPSLSPSGRYFAFSSPRLEPGETPDSPTCGQFGCVKVRVYDAEKGVLACASCSDDAAQDRDARLRSNDARGSQLNGTVGRVVLDDGTVFFATSAALANGDTNGTSDVYEWRDGVRALISPGDVATDARFVTASEDGSDVFFATSQKLVAQDVDDTVDLYDARVDGGIAAQNAPSRAKAPCDSDTCQGQFAGSVLTPTPESESHSGPGNPGVIGRPTIGKVKVSSPRSVRGNGIGLTVDAPAAGRIVVSGAGIRRASRVVSGAGRTRVEVRLSSTKARSFARNRKTTVAVLVQFTPHGRSTVSSTARARLNFRAKGSTRRATVQSSTTRKAR